MTKDAFGHEVKFGVIIRVGRRRRDGKYSVGFLFQSTGQRTNKLLTQAQLDQQCEKMKGRGDVQIVGYSPPLGAPTPAQARDVEARQVEEMRAQLSRAGFDPAYAEQLAREGMGPHELSDRLAIPEGVGSLPYTHGFRKSARDLDREIETYLRDE
jgi:chorismate mutase